MPAPPTHDTQDIVIAATLWLMHRYRLTGCSKLARLVEQHLRWIETGVDNPQRATLCQHLALEWRSGACTPSSPTAIH